MGLGMFMLWQIPNAAGTKLHFGGSAYPLAKWFDPTAIGLSATTVVYVGFVAVVVNAVVAVLVTLICRAAGLPDGVDSTRPDDYLADEGDPRTQGPGVDELAAPLPKVPA